MKFDPGTPLGVFVISPAGRNDTALFDVIEGGEPDEVTLNCTYVSDERPSWFTFSVRTPLLAQITQAYFDEPAQRAVLDALGREGARLRLVVGDQPTTAQFVMDRVERGNALIELRDEASGAGVARIAGIRGTEGFAWIAVAIVVVGVVYVVTRHRENMAAIEKCVPIDNQINVTITMPDGTSTTFQGRTRVHKTDELAE